jgi:hypothetical protein
VNNRTPIFELESVASRGLPTSIHCVIPRRGDLRLALFRFRWNDYDYRDQVRELSYNGAARLRAG